MNRLTFPDLNAYYKPGQRLPLRKELYLLTVEQLMTDYCALSCYINHTVEVCGGWICECTGASDLQARIASVIKVKLSALYN